MKRLVLMLSAVSPLALVMSCAQFGAVTKATLDGAAGVGLISKQTADAGKSGVDLAVEAFDVITPEQEYWIGRTVAAMLLKSTKPYDNTNVNNYLNTLGQSLATASKMPETFGGYHFLATDTEEISAFSAPGGLILVSRGLLKCCRNEDELAAVLAHEITHIQERHGVRAIKKGRLTSKTVATASKTVQAMTSTDVGQLAGAFEDCVNDVASTLVNSGYSKAYEYDADAGAVEIMKTLGYNPVALRSMLQEMEKRVKPEAGFGKTHPAAKDRIKKIDGLIKGVPPVSEPAERLARFQKAMAGV
jgi:beta-barrel assembly-enhancing protease